MQIGPPVPQAKDSDTAPPRGRLVFVFDYPISDSQLATSGLAQLRDFGFSIEIWDVGWVNRPEAQSMGLPRTAAFKTTVFSDFRVFRTACRELGPDVVVIRTCMLSWYGLWLGRRLLRCLSETPAPLCAAMAANLPDLLRPAPHSLAWYRRLLSRVSDWQAWKRIAQRLAMRRPLSSLFMRGIRPLDLLWAGIAVNAVAAQQIGAHTRVEFIHEYEYDRVLECIARGDRPSAGIVLVDQMGPLHPDYVWRGTSAQLSSEEYTQLLCRTLDNLEDQLGSRVVVAAHPQARPGQIEPLYGGRQVVYGGTAQLIATSEFVVVPEGSTATFIAIGMRRPIVFLESPLFDPYGQALNIWFADSLALPIIDVHAQAIPVLTLDVDEARYSAFTKEFIKREGTPELPFWDCVARDLDTLLGAPLK